MSNGDEKKASPDALKVPSEKGSGSSGEDPVQDANASTPLTFLPPAAPTPAITEIVTTSTVTAIPPLVPPLTGPKPGASEPSRASTGSSKDSIEKLTPSAPFSAPTTSKQRVATFGETPMWVPATTTIPPLVPLQADPKTDPFGPRLEPKETMGSKPEPSSPQAGRAFLGDPTPPIYDQKQRLPPAEDRVTPLTSVDPAFPLVLLPVRIETRFIDRHLWVRVYPDEIFADAHEPELTAAEVAAAIRYWSSPPQHEEAAWDELAQNFTAPRAAWIVERTRNDRTAAGVERKSSGWTRAVIARLLPERWIVHLQPPGERVEALHFVGSRIRAELALTLRPSDPSDQSPRRESDLATDPEMLWTIDFDQAVAAGMAMRIPIGDRTTFTRVLVFGLRTQTDPQRSALELGRLFDAHRYTQGLAFVRQGTPTNNSEASPAGFSADRRTVPSGKEPPALRPDQKPEANAAVLARAFGVTSSRFQGLEGEKWLEQFSAARMNQALWPATLGYFLSHRLASDTPESEIRVVQEHFVTHVRGRGSLPAFRVGRVPYGVLPVSSLARWVSVGESFLDKRLPELLRAGLPFWRSAIRDVPCVGRTPDDPERDLLEILGMDAISREVRVRASVGAQTLINAADLLGIGEELAREWCREGAGRLPVEVRRMGFGTHLAGTVYHANAPRCTDPLVTAGTVQEDRHLPAVARDGESTNYIRAILGASLEDLRDPATSLPAFESPTLLARLLRHSALLELVRVAWLVRYLANTPTVTPSDRDRMLARPPEPELLVPANDLGVSPWTSVDESDWLRPLLVVDPDRIPLNVPQLPEGTRDAQAAATTLRQLVTNELRPFAQALRDLATTPTAELERLAMETLDTCSHRIDAWIESLYARRLRAMRQEHPQGCYVGAYAWVENLSARGDRPPSEGYIHGPSLDHAATAAVLRNAFSTHGRTGQFALDLSSARVAAAQAVLDQVRAGQSLGEVLGMRVERALHDAQLDRYIDPLRRRFPLVANKTTNSGLPADDVAGRSVVDGLALQRDYTSFLASTTRYPEAAREFFRQLGTRLNETIDAVSDLLTAEATFQVVRGNPSIAGASLDAIGRGTRPPDPEIARSPRSGVSITHRVGLLFPPAGQLKSAELDAGSFRALVEPSLEEWAARVLGDFRRVKCLLEARVAGSSNTTTPTMFEVSLADLGLSALEILALSHEVPSTWRLEAPASPREAPRAPAAPLNRWVLMRAASVRPDLTVTAIRHEVQDPARDLSFPQLWEAASTLDDVLQNARPMRPQDLADPASSQASVTSLVPSEASLARIEAALIRFQGVCNALTFDPKGEPRDIDLDSLRLNLKRAARFGVVGAVPAPAPFAEGTESATIAQARTVAREMIQRLARAAGAPAPEGVAIESLVAGARTRLRTETREVLAALFGAPPLLLLPFDPPGPERVATALGAGPGLGATPSAIRHWCIEAARVRPPLARWQKLSTYAAALGTSGSPRAASATAPSERGLTLQIAQFTTRSFARWAALPFPQSPKGEITTPPGGTISFALHAPSGLPQGRWAGLVVDEWAELAPNARELTGIAFHYDDPGAEAPQTILVAVPPVEGQAWSESILVDVLNETLDLAKVRAVDAERIGPLAQHLPAIHLADNAQNTTVTTDFGDHLESDA